MTFAMSRSKSWTRRCVERILGARDGQLAGLGGNQLDAAAIARHRRAAQQAPLLETVDERGERRPAHADARRELARALGLTRDRDQQPVLGQADAGRLAGLLGDAGQAREQPDPGPEVRRDFRVARRSAHRFDPEWLRASSSFDPESSASAQMRIIGESSAI